MMKCFSLPKALFFYVKKYILCFTKLSALYLWTFQKSHHLSENLLADAVFNENLPFSSDLLGSWTSLGWRSLGWDRSQAKCRDNFVLTSEKSATCFLCQSELGTYFGGKSDFLRLTNCGCMVCPDFVLNSSIFSATRERETNEFRLMWSVKNACNCVR